MDKLSFNKLLVKTAFSCMASDGDIDPKELEVLSSLFEKLENINTTAECNKLIEELNSNARSFFKTFYKELETSDLTVEHQLEIINYAKQTIEADEKVEYSEVKFFKTIRHRLNISDEKILEVYPDIEFWLIEDIDTGNDLSKITDSYLDAFEIKQFEFVDLN
jgi:uncharacterized tellurite resistance protein B-like protein